MLNQIQYIKNIVKIANILLSNQNGGVEQSFVGYCRILKNLGHEVLAIVGEEAPYIKDLQSLDIQIIQVKNSFGYYDFPAISKIKKSLENFGCQLVFAHTGRAIILAKKSIKKLSKKIPLIAVNHSRNVKRSIGADIVLSVNKEIFYKTVDLGQAANRSFVMPNFIDIDKNEEQKFELKDFILNQDKPIVIGTIARLAKEKNLEFLIEAVKILSDQNYQIKLKIAGSGQEEQGLRNLCTSLNLNQQVEFLGWIEDKKSFFSQIDIFCLPSKEETFGIVLLEAMLYNKPIVTTNTDGAKMILKDKISGILVDNSDQTKLASLIASAILDLLNNPEIIFDLTTNAKRDLVKFYSTQAVESNIKEIIGYLKK